MKTLDCISVENMRESDRMTIEKYVSGRALMYRAAMGVFRAVNWHGEIVIAVGGGNYLLLDADGWRDLSRFADYTIVLTADADMLRERLIGRKMKTGMMREDAEQFVKFSDMPNVRLCLDKTMKADLELSV